VTVLAIISAFGLIGLGMEIAVAFALARDIRRGNPSNERAEIVIQRRSRVLLVHGSSVDKVA
jgi:hypothetical protein